MRLILSLRLSSFAEFGNVAFNSIWPFSVSKIVFVDIFCREERNVWQRCNISQFGFVIQNFPTTFAKFAFSSLSAGSTITV